MMAKMGKMVGMGHGGTCGSGGKSYGLGKSGGQLLDYDYEDDYDHARVGVTGSEYSY